MKKLFIVLMIFALCTQPVFAMQTNIKNQKKTEKKESSSATAIFNSWVTVGVIVITGGLLVKASMEQEPLKIWHDMQKECWDPCLEQPYYSHQKSIQKDHWLEQVWDTRVNKYRDELNCPNKEQDLELIFEGCARLETLEDADQSALACVSDIQAHGFNLTATIIDQTAEIGRRAVARNDCFQSAQYLEWKKERKPKFDAIKLRWTKEPIPAPLNPLSLCSIDSPYWSTLYRDNQPHVVDISRCRVLTADDCPKDHIPDFGRALIKAFSRKKQCDKFSEPDQEKKDGDEVSQETVHALIKAGCRWLNAPAYRPKNHEQWAKRECPIWQAELEKKNQE